jgi:uncharacterized protein YqjF (DUF2071 family)
MVTWPRRGLHSRLLTIRIGEVVEPTPLPSLITANTA